MFPNETLQVYLTDRCAIKELLEDERCCKQERARENVVCMRDVADQLVAPALLEVCCCLLIRCAVMPLPFLLIQPHLVLAIK